ncbi:MAG TPA: hypothetical protein VK557_17585 [Pyrinomonadaceae bacterium]|nr:hypothetical protein [Pyrinomonadaceae bacterium]
MAARPARTFFRTALDDFAIQLQHEPQAKGVIIFYGGKISFWLQPASYDQPQFKEASGRIGHGGLDVQSDVEGANETRKVET